MAYRKFGAAVAEQITTFARMLFEAWLAKAVPVVLPTPAFKDLEAQGFPFVVVQRWEEVTPGLLEAYLKDDVQGYGAIDWDRVHFLSSLEGLAENLDR